MSSRVKWCLKLITANHLQTFPTITAKRTSAAAPLTRSQGGGKCCWSVDHNFESLASPRAWILRCQGELHQTAPST